MQIDKRDSRFYLDLSEMEFRALLVVLGCINTGRFERENLVSGFGCSDMPSNLSFLMFDQMATVFS